MAIEYCWTCEVPKSFADDEAEYMTQSATHHWLSVDCWTCELRNDKNSYRRPCSIDRTFGDAPSNVTCQNACNVIRELMALTIAQCFTARIFTVKYYILIGLFTFGLSLGLSISLIIWPRFRALSEPRQFPPPKSR